MGKYPSLILLLKLMHQIRTNCSFLTVLGNFFCKEKIILSNYYYLMHFLNHHQCIILQWIFYTLPLHTYFVELKRQTNHEFFNKKKILPSKKKKFPQKKKKKKKKKK